MMMRRPATGLAVLIVAILGLAGCLPPPPPPPPLRMVAVGDSITTATNVDWCCVSPDGANPQYSWSTGTAPAVQSHYQRLRALHGGTNLPALNAADPGADSADLQAQLTEALNFDATHVTVLIGANDVCSGPTSVDAFRQRIESAFADFFSAAPDTQMFVASIPNLWHLWSIEHTNSWAQLVWDAFDICPTMLPSNVTDAQRQAMLTLETQFNDILATTCARYRTCTWDGHATFNYPFTNADVSPVDHYHPSIQGQNSLADVTWNASSWN